MIFLTIALPLFRAKHIAWLAMESLSRQKGISFEWELVAIEETNNSVNGEIFGRDNIEVYRDRLLNVGCKSIKYIPLESWIPLGDKWGKIALESDEHSSAFVLQSADCYSSENRLVKAASFISKGKDWIHSKIHTFYHIRNDSLYQFNQPDVINFSAADMTVKMSIARHLPLEHKSRHVDQWFFKNAKKVMGKSFKLYVDDDYSHLSLNVNGINNISNRDDIFDKDKRFVRIDKKIDDIVPTEVSQKLHLCKSFIDIERPYIK